MWSEDERRSAVRLIRLGLSDREVARQTGVPRSTVGSWRRKPDRARRYRRGDPSWRPADSRAYCYALGLYLGDGHIVRSGASARLFDVILDWQLALTTLHAASLIRGLVHSDGCRTINRFSTKLPSGRIGHYEYPRYFFSNLSADIRRIFCEHCELLGIDWTLSNPRNVSISDKDSVAILDRFVGPKS